MARRKKVWSLCKLVCRAHSSHFYFSHGDNHSSRRSWQHRSRSRSRSSSSDSTSSTSSSHGRGRKRSRHDWSEKGTRQASGEGGKRSDNEGDDEARKDADKGEGGKKRRCKDYDGKPTCVLEVLVKISYHTEKGFCMLGDQCPFDHGVDPVVIGNNIPHTYPPPPSMVGIPSLPLTKPG